MNKLSVITPAYNSEKWIFDLYNSIKINLLNQEYINENNFNWIVVNDGSTDNTNNIINSFNEKWIKIINQKNSGLGAARSMGWKESNSEFIWHIDSDDFIQNNAFKIIGKELNTTIDIIKIADNHYDDLHKKIKPQPLYKYKKFKKNPHIWPQGLIMRSSIIPRDFSFFPKNGDIANLLIFDQLDWSRFKILNKAIVNYRVNLPQSMSSSPSFLDIQRTAEYSLIVFENVISKNIKKASLRNALFDYCHAIMIAKVQKKKINIGKNYNYFSFFQKLLVILTKITPKWIAKLIF